MDVDLRRLMKGADGPGVPTRGGGTRWYVANTEGLDIFRLSPGDVRLDQANVHSGPHVYVSRVGTCFPLKGNTAPWPAVRMSEAQFFDHVALETLDDAVGLWEPTAMAATAFPERTAPDHKHLAKALVGRLLARGWVDLFAKSLAATQRGEWEPVSKQGQPLVLDALSDDIAWDPLGIAKASIRYFVLASELGDNEFHQDLRRRGLYADRPRRRSLWPF